MWLFMREGFLSIKQDNDSKDILIVRSRFEGDIEKLIGVKPFMPVESDYPLHAHVDRDVVVKAIVDQVKNIDYPSFKSSISDPRRIRRYVQVWAVMDHLQQDLEAKTMVRR